jgi:anthranilate/para-aminobenzoate synthase component I
VPRLPELPAFTGGLVGYFGFECIGYIEPRLPRCATSPTNSARPTSC